MSYTKKEKFNMRTPEQKKVEVTRDVAVKALNQIIRGNQDKVDNETLIYNLTGESENALLPEDLKHDLDEAKKQNKSVRQYVDVVPVETESGTFTDDAEGNANKELVEFESGSTELTEQQLKLNGVPWSLKSYGSFTPIGQSLVEDSAFDLTTFFERNHAEKATKTENNLVFDAITTGLATKALASVNALETSLNQDLDPALENEIVVITNQDGFEVIKPNVEYFKNEDGKPKAFLGKYPVEVYSNDDLTSNTGTVPVIYGSLKRTVKLFDLERPEVLLVKHPFGIRSRSSVLRGVEHFDVKLMPNSTKTIYGEITTA